MNDIDPSAIADAGHTTAQIGGGSAVLAWLTSSQAGVAAGILIGVVGLLVQWYYRRKQDQREEAEHELRMTLRQDGYEARAALHEDSVDG
jgi:hypothetical protein